MRAPDVFGILVRFVGFLALMMGVWLFCQMLFTPMMSFTFKNVLYIISHLAVGLVVIKMAPVIGAFAYSDEG